MSNTKAVIAVLVHVALIVFVVFAIWPALKSSGTDGYNTKTAGVIVGEQIAEEEIDEEVEEPAMPENMTDETVAAVVEEVETAEVVEAGIDEAAVTEEVETTEVVDAVTEQVEVAEAAIEEAVVTEEVETTEVVEAVTEQVEEVETVVEEVAVEEVVAEEKPAMGGGQVHVVTAQGLKYEPLVTVIALGDTVAWENMSSHDTQAIEGLVPEGSERWHSSMGENYQRTFTQEGIYIYKCTPHWGAAMGGVIIVGNPVNLEAIKAATAKGAAKRLVKKAIKAAEAM